MFGYYLKFTTIYKRNDVSFIQTKIFVNRCSRNLGVFGQKNSPLNKWNYYAWMIYYRTTTQYLEITTQEATLQTNMVKSAYVI